MLYRREYDITTGEVIMIELRVYKSGDDILMLDAGVEPPEGYVEFDPFAEVVEGD